MSPSENLKPKVRFDYTMLSTWQECRRKFFWKFILNLRSPFPAVPLLFGHAIHEALDVWYKGGGDDAAIAAFEADWDDGFRDEKRNTVVAKRLLKHYFNKWRGQTFKVLASEKQFSLPIGNGTEYCGRIDRVIEWDKVVHIMDSKTTSRMTSDIFNSKKVSMQLEGYTWAARQLGYPGCNHAALDVLLVAKTKADAARDTYYVSDEKIKRHMDKVILLTRAIVKAIDYSNSKMPMDIVWLQNCSSCSNWNRICPYHKLCVETDTRVIESIVAQDYKIEVWDPVPTITKEEDNANIN